MKTTTNYDIFERDFRDVCFMLSGAADFREAEKGLFYAALMCDSIGAPLLSVSVRGMNVALEFAAGTTGAPADFVKAMWHGFGQALSTGRLHVAQATVRFLRRSDGSLASAGLTRPVTGGHAGPFMFYSLDHYLSCSATSDPIPLRIGG